MNMEKMKAAAAAIHAHYTIERNEFTLMKFAGYDDIPLMAYKPEWLEQATSFLSLLRMAPEFQTDGSYNPSDLDVMKFLFKLNRWGVESTRIDQLLTQKYEQGHKANLEGILPGIEEKRLAAENCLKYMAPFSELYDSVRKIEMNRHSLEDTDEQHKKRISHAESHGVHQAHAFLQLHKDPKVIEAQIEVLGKLAELSERHFSVTQKARLNGVQPVFMHCGSAYSTGYQLDGLSLPQFFDNFMTASGLDSDTTKLLMEDAPAGKYLSGMLMTAFSADLNKGLEFRHETMADYLNESASLTGKMPLHQPKGHQNGADLGQSLQTAKDSVLSIIAGMDARLTEFEQSLEGRAARNGSFIERLKESHRSGGSAKGVGD